MVISSFIWLKAMYKCFVIETKHESHDLNFSIIRQPIQIYNKKSFQQKVQSTKYSL